MKKQIEGVLENIEVLGSYKAEDSFLTIIIRRLTILSDSQPHSILYFGPIDQNILAQKIAFSQEAYKVLFSTYVYQKITLGNQKIFATWFSKSLERKLLAAIEKSN